MVTILILLTRLAGAVAAPQGGPAAADLVIRDARIHTAAAARPRATAMAVHGGRIVAVGGEREVRPWIGERTEVWNLAGRTVLPGLVDSHGHLAGLGDRLALVDLVGTRSYEEVIARVAERAREIPEGDWVLGRGWDQNDWPAASMPRHEALSLAVPRHPVSLERIDGHALLVNRRALEIAGIGPETPDPPGGMIERGPDGAPSGVLVDNAAGLVERLLPPPSGPERERRLLAAMRACARVGITLVHDAGIGPETLEGFRALLARGEFPIRVYAMAAAASGLLDEVLERGPELGERFTLRAIKAVYDGAMGSRGALMSAPYSDRPDHLGLERMTVDSLARIASTARRRGLQMRVHAIGDLANTRVLDAFERAFEGKPDPEARWAIEHAQVVRPADIRRFRSLGVVASMQATHATSDGPWAESRIGAARLPWSYAWRQFLRAGVRFANGSDFPVESENPLLGLYASITRRDLDGKLPSNGWRREERLTPGEALLSFTLWGAYLAFREADLGSLEVGKRADFVIVDRDVIDGPPDAIPGARILRTVVGGETVYQAASP